MQHLPPKFVGKIETQNNNQNNQNQHWCTLEKYQIQSDSVLHKIFYRCVTDNKCQLFHKK